MRTPRCKCGKPKRTRRRSEKKQHGLFYAHNCTGCQRIYMLRYWKNRGREGFTVTERGLDKRKAMTSSLKVLRLVHRALTGVELAR